MPRLGAQRICSQVFALPAELGPAQLGAPGASEQLPQSLWVRTGQVTPGSARDSARDERKPTLPTPRAALFPVVAAGTPVRAWYFLILMGTN